MASFKDFVMSQPEREFRISERAILTPAPTPRSTSSFRAFVDGGKAAATPAANAWNASAHEPSLDDDAIRDRNLALIIPPEPKRPPRRCHVRATERTALYAEATSPEAAASRAGGET